MEIIRYCIGIPIIIFFMYYIYQNLKTPKDTEEDKKIRAIREKMRFRTPLYEITDDLYPEEKNTVPKSWIKSITKDDFIWSEHKKGSHILFYDYDPETSCAAFCTFSNKKAFDAFVRDFNLQDKLNKSA